MPAVCLRKKNNEEKKKTCDVAEEVICFHPFNDGLHFMQIGVWGQQIQFNTYA